MGIFSKAYGSKNLVLNLPEKSTVETVINELISKNEVLRKVLWDSGVDSPIPNAIIMINGIEINNLQGIDTVLLPDQELVLLSVIHGG
jgi:molybdopterin converting factor small subunit